MDTFVFASLLFFHLKLDLLQSETRLLFKELGKSGEGSPEEIERLISEVNFHVFLLNNALSSWTSNLACKYVTDTEQCKDFYVRNRYSFALLKGFFKGILQYILFFGLSIRTFEVKIISIVKFLITS